MTNNKIDSEKLSNFFKNLSSLKGFEYLPKENIRDKLHLRNRFDMINENNEHEVINDNIFVKFYSSVQNDLNNESNKKQTKKKQKKRKKETKKQTKKETK